MGLVWFFLASVAGGQESNSTGYTDSGGFALDTQDVQNLGFAESGGFTLDTGAVQGLATPGTAVSSGFVLDTQGSVNSAPVDLNQTGFADSGGFIVDTSNGTASPADSNQSGFEDSGGFAVDTQDPNPSENTGHNDSGGFVLDTGGDDGSGQTAHSDSGGFGLDTRDNLNPTTDPNTTGFEDSGGFALDTNDANGNLPVTNAPPTELNSTAPLSIDENQPVGTFVGEFNASDDALVTSFILDPNDQNPSPPNAYEHGNVDSTDDTFYAGQTNLNRWTSTSGCRKR
jgi:hypothetical protein